MSSPVRSRPPDAGAVTRRQFVRGASAVAALAVVGGAGALARRRWQGLRNYAEWYSGAFLPLERRIARHLSYLRLDPAGVRAFADAYRKATGRRVGPTARYDRTVFDLYLMSTDFFVHGGDESREVRFVAYYDPYVSPCWNPFRTAAASPRA